MVYDLKANNTDLTVKKVAERIKIQRKWQEQLNLAKNDKWMRMLIKNIAPWVNRCFGQINYKLTQVLSEHSCFHS